jgi:hypothetical protein
LDHNGRWGERMEDTIKEDKDLVVEIDSRIYETVALLGMRMGRDDITEFINDMLYYELKKEQRKRKNRDTIG